MKYPLALIAGLASFVPLASAEEPDAVALGAGSVVERPVKTKETHRYAIDLRAGEYFQSVIEQHDADVAQTLIGPDGQTILEVDTFSAGNGPDPLAFVARMAGRHVLAVQANDDQPGSRYVLRVEAVREPAERDLARVEAVRHTAEFSRLSVTFATARPALEHGRQAVEAWRDLGERRLEMYAESGVGFVHRAVLAEIKEARPPLERALAIAREIGEVEFEGGLLFNLGEASSRLGLFAEARSYFEQAIALHRARGRPDKEGYVLMALGRAWVAAGDPQQGLDHLQHALQVYEPIGDIGGFFDPRALARLYMANAYLELSEHELALTHYQAVRPAFSRHKSLAAPLVTGIGSALFGMGDLAGARAAYAEALGLWGQLGVPGLEADTSLRIGDVHREEADLRAADELYLSALAVFQRRGDRAGEAKAQCRRGEVHRRLGALPAARTAFEAALLAAPADNASLRACAGLGLARVALAEGRLEEARAQAETALASAESLRASVAAPRTRAATLEAHQGFYETLIDIRIRQHERDPQGGHDAAALEVSERARARTLLELLAEGRVEVRAGAPATLLEQERRLRDQLNAAAREQEEPATAQRAERMEALARDITDLVTELADVQGRIRRASPHYAELAQPQPLSAAEVRRQVLDGETILLEYALGEERSHVWIVSKEAVTTVALAPRAQIESAARRLYDSAASPPGPRSQTTWSEAVAELSRLVLPPPAIGLLTGKRLLVVAPGALQYVPFAALQVAGGPLLDRFEVTSAPSASVVATLRRDASGRPRASRTVATFADPVFDLGDPRVPAVARRPTPAGPPSPAVPMARALRSLSRGPLARLPFSRQEAEAIRALAPPGSSLQAMGFEASRQAALAPALADYRIVHFATHGVLNARQPELSGVVLSLVDARGQPQDGFLRLHDVYNLRLNAELVVLSGCRTALGKDLQGEGLVGLTRGFLYAGARAVVASLWQVDDESTAELMKRFYRGMLQEDRRPADALRAAQLEMSRHRRWSAPFHWAGFVLQGEWR